MLKLRPYKPCDAEKIAGWIKSEEALRKWSADRFGDYPISAEDINSKYIKNNGDCEDPENFFPMTAFDESGAVGHLIMRFTDFNKTTLRFGFVIVDDTKRGKGYGKEMLKLSLKYAFEILKVQKVTLGVFSNNASAYYCYKAAGFTECKDEEGFSMQFFGEEWVCIEMKCEKLN